VYRVRNEFAWQLSAPVHTPDSDGELVKIKVLLVDGDPNELARTEHHLRTMTGLEAQVTTVANMAAAMFAACADTFDAIVSEKTVRTESGLDLIQALRRDGNETPCIIVSDKLTDEFETDASKSGVWACISKRDVSAHLLEITLTSTHPSSTALYQSDINSPSSMLRTGYASLGAQGPTSLTE